MRFSGLLSWTPWPPRRGCNLDSSTCRAEAPRDCKFSSWRRPEKLKIGRSRGRQQGAHTHQWNNEIIYNELPILPTLIWFDLVLYFGERVSIQGCSPVICVASCRSGPKSQTFIYWRCAMHNLDKTLYKTHPCMYIVYYTIYINLQHWFIRLLVNLPMYRDLVWISEYIHQNMMLSLCFS